MKKIGVAILGLGTVGSGTYQILKDNHEHIKNSQGLDITVEAVLEINKQRARDLGIDESIVFSNMAEIVCNPNIDVVIEVIGGVTYAKDFILTALKHSKIVVTANKELIAKHWEEIESVAKAHNTGFYFEASCVGGVPIIRTLTDGMQANNIESIVGIINGTTNYILTKMASGLEYDEALKEAQALGYAEANPTADVDGFDAAYKLSILASLAFSKKVPLEKVKREGISNIQKLDIDFGNNLGYTLKLLAIGKQTAKGIEVSVSPTFVKHSHPLASVNGSFNAVFLKGDMVDDIMLYGRGAGALPTGSAIVSDVIFSSKRSEHYYVPFENAPKKKISTVFADDISAKFYLRISAKDEIGVLAKISSIFGNNNVSITHVMQEKIEDSDTVPIIFITHETSEKALQKAIKEIEKLTVIDAVEAVIRVENA